jgi:hypothetical protein
MAEAVLHSDVDTDRAVALANRWNTSAALAEGVRATWSELRLADVVALSTWSQSRHTRRVAGSSAAGIPAAFGRLARVLSLRPGGRR